MKSSSTRWVYLLYCFLQGVLLGDENDGRLNIYWIDVEGGAATLVVSPGGQSILIDSGNPGQRDADRIHEVITQRAGLDHLDFLITTHFHLDHFGGAAELAQKLPIHAVYDKGIPSKSPDRQRPDARFPLLIKPYRDMNVGQRHLILPGSEIPLRQRNGSPPLTLRCLAVNRQMIDIPVTESSLICQEEVPPKAQDLSDNASSVVLLLEFGPFRFFDAGDLTWNLEHALVCPVNRVGKVDVYQVTHHGLDQSNHPSLLRALEPRVSIMNNGVTKGCGANTFETLSSLGSLQAMYQLHRNLREDDHHNAPEEHIANLSKECQGLPLRLIVSPDGTSYEVEVSRSGHRRRFETRSTSDQ